MYTWGVSSECTLGGYRPNVHLGGIVRVVREVEGRVSTEEEVETMGSKTSVKVSMKTIRFK